MKETFTAKALAMDDLVRIIKRYSREKIESIQLTEEEATIHYEGGGIRKCRVGGDSVVMTIIDVCKEIVR